MSWQLTGAAGTPVVRKRHWLTFQPGEVRVCSACHAVNPHDQLGAAAPTNPPEALRAAANVEGVADDAAPAAIGGEVKERR